LLSGFKRVYTKYPRPSSDIYAAFLEYIEFIAYSTCRKLEASQQSPYEKGELSTRSLVRLVKLKLGEFPMLHSTSLGNPSTTAQTSNSNPTSSPHPYYLSLLPHLPTTTMPPQAPRHHHPQRLQTRQTHPLSRHRRQSHPHARLPNPGLLRPQPHLAASPRPNRLHPTPRILLLTPRAEQRRAQQEGHAAAKPSCPRDREAPQGLPIPSREMGEVGMANGEQWKPSCKTSSATFSFEGICADARIMAKMLGVEDATKFKAKRYIPHTYTNTGANKRG